MKRFLTGRVLLAIAGWGVVATLCSCSKTNKTSTAGGGSSTQSVMTIKGAGR